MSKRETKAPKQILDIYLKTCFEVHGEKIPIKYEPYIIRAMEQYASQFKPVLPSDYDIYAKFPTDTEEDIKAPFYEAQHIARENALRQEGAKWMRDIISAAVSSAKG